MSFAKNYNTDKKFTHTPSENAPYVKPLQLLEKYGEKKVYPIRALYTSNKGKFGTSASIACDGFLVNAPSHLVETIEQMLNDESAINAINAGIAGFQLYPYENKFGKQAGLTWVDIKPTPEPENPNDDIPF